MTIVLGHPVKNLPINDDVKLDLDSIWQYVFGSKASDTSSSELAGKVNLSRYGNLPLKKSPYSSYIDSCISRPPKSLFTIDWLPIF